MFTVHLWRTLTKAAVLGCFIVISIQFCASLGLTQPVRIKSGIKRTRLLAMWKRLIRRAQLWVTEGKRAHGERPIKLLLSIPEVSALLHCQHFGVLRTKNKSTDVAAC